MIGQLPAKGAQFFNVPVANAQIPAEGPKCIGGVIPFASGQNNQWQLNMLLSEGLQQISQIQCIYLDNSDNDSEVEISVSIINVRIPFPANSAGYIPLPAPKNVVVTFTSDSDADIPFMIFNVPLPGVIWSASDDGGNEYVSAPDGATTELGANGHIGDYLDGLLIIPSSTSPGTVQIQDGANAPITVFAGGVNSVGSLVPFFVPVNSQSTNGGWSVITNANATVLAQGQFTNA